MAKTWTARAVLSWTREHFERHGVEAPRLSAELLLAHVLGCRRLDLFLDLDRPLNPDERSAFRGFVRRRTRGEPVAYLVGYKDFYGLRLKVGSEVLIPRPETELIVELAEALEPAPSSIVDLGTGSGALALALATRIPGSRVVATDISPAAVALAKENATELGLESRVRCVVSDWDSAIASELESGVDLVVSNPPYVAEGEVVDPWVARFEPAEALFDLGPRGLGATRRVLKAAELLLREGGRLLVEIGAGKARAVSALASARGFSGLAVHRDLSGTERVVACEKPALVQARREERR